jgi:CBS-domain-containing membrane protein
MNTEPRVLHFDDPIRDAIALMETGRYRNVPIVDDGGIVAGIVRPQDVLRYLAEAFPEEVLNLPPRPHQRMKESEGA